MTHVQIMMHDISTCVRFKSGTRGPLVGDICQTVAAKLKRAEEKWEPNVRPRLSLPTG